jgi:hypothetical protein
MCASDEKHENSSHKPKAQAAKEVMLRRKQGNGEGAAGSVGVLTFSPMSMALDRGPPERRLPEQERERKEGKKGGHGNDGGRWAEAAF